MPGVFFFFFLFLVISGKLSTVSLSLSLRDPNDTSKDKKENDVGVPLAQRIFPLLLSRCVGLLHISLEQPCDAFIEFISLSFSMLMSSQQLIFVREKETTRSWWPFLVFFLAIRCLSLPFSSFIIFSLDMETNDDEKREREEDVQESLTKVSSWRILISFNWHWIHSTRKMIRWTRLTLLSSSFFSCLFLLWSLCLLLPRRPQMKTEEEQHQLLYLGFSIHQEVASDSFCFLINSSWLLVFILYLFFIFFIGFNLYCWKGIYFS